MDFHTLSRKELQALCKKNKIPANITNVAMANALSELPQVEGLDEILNPKEGDIGTPSIQIRTASRTTTQRKGVKEPESSKVSTRPSRGTRTEVVEQENKDANVSATPAVMPSSRRRVPAVSTRRKKEVVEDGDDSKNGLQEKPKDVSKTPAAAPSSRKRVTGRSVCNKNETPSSTSVQKAYSTRRSVRLLGKSLSEMSLVETEDMGLDKIDDVSEELSSISQHVEDSSITEKGDSLQTESIAVSESTEEFEVSSFIKAEDEGQSHDFGSEDKLVSEKESDVKDELQVEPEEEGSGKVEHVEPEPNDSSLNLQGSFDECGDSNEAGSELLPELVDSAKVENKECSETNQRAISFEACEEASMEIPDEKDVTSTEGILEIVADGSADHIENFEPMHDDINEAADNKDVLSTEQVLENVADRNVNHVENFEASEEVSMKIADKKDVSNTEEFLENVADGNASHFENFEPSEEVSVEIDDIKEVSSTEEVFENVADDNVSHFENFEASEEVSVEIDDIKDVSSTEEVLVNVADDNVNHNFEPMYDDIDEAADNKDALRVLEKDTSSSEDRQEEALEIKPEHQVDEISGNFGAVNIEVEDVAVQLSLLGEDQITEGQKDISEKLKAEAQAEESEVAAGEDHTVIDDGNAFLSVEDGIQMSFSHQQVESNGISSTLVEADGDTNGSSETMTVAQLNEQEQVLSDVAIGPVISESLCIAQLEETKEIPTVTNLMKENLIAEFQKMSLRGLKKKLKDLDSKSKSMTDNDALSMQEGERKRTALQALPQNQLTTGEDHKDV